MYSSIEEESRKEVIQKCYWPLFKLADSGIPIGIEATATTLEIINKLDPDWVSTLSKYIIKNKIEFIGSGYSQIIGPLVPAQVCEWNQKLGLESYNEFFGLTPKLALVNEMAYSSGIVEHYINVGYEGIIMEWNNPRSNHPKWENEWRYFPQKALGTNGEPISIIWSDSIAFQKFQRFAHGEIELDEYSQYLKKHLGNSGHFFPLYSNDVEIFDYRPGRYKTEAKFNGNSEWDRIIEVYNFLSKQNWCDFVFPNQVLSGLNNRNGGIKLKFETPSQPIPVKKQEKYNINRWALTGVADLEINTKCYKIYNTFIDKYNINPKDWAELCYLWSSDFRTHITENRWNNYIKRLNNKIAICNSKKIQGKRVIDNSVKFVDNEKWIKVKNANNEVVFNKNKGLTIQSFVIEKFGKNSVLGTLDHGYYDNISFGADYFSGHAVIERPGFHKVTDLEKTNPIIDENSRTIFTHQKNGNYKFDQKIKFEDNKIIFEKHIETKCFEKAIIRPHNFTFNPEFWDRESLYVATHNGGANLEKYYLKGCNFSHVQIYSTLISACHGFGNTEGIYIIGDKFKYIKFECEMITSALIPSIIYKEVNGVIFLRLLYSAREIDDTHKTINLLELKSKITINI